MVCILVNCTNSYYQPKWFQKFSLYLTRIFSACECECECSVATFPFEFLWNCTWKTHVTQWDGICTVSIWMWTNVSVLYYFLFSSVVFLIVGCHGFHSFLLHTFCLHLPPHPIYHHHHLCSAQNLLLLVYFSLGKLFYKFYAWQVAKRFIRSVRS